MEKYSIAIFGIFLTACTPPPVNHNSTTIKYNDFLEDGPYITVPAGSLEFQIPGSRPALQELGGCIENLPWVYPVSRPRYKSDAVKWSKDSYYYRAYQEIEGCASKEDIVKMQKQLNILGYTSGGGDLKNAMVEFSKKHDLNKSMVSFNSPAATSVTIFKTRVAPTRHFTKVVNGTIKDASRAKRKIQNRKLFSCIEKEKERIIKDENCPPPKQTQVTTYERVCEEYNPRYGALGGCKSVPRTSTQLVASDLACSARMDARVEQARLACKAK